MTTGDMIRELRRLEEAHRDDFVGTGEPNWSLMCRDVANRLEELLKAQEPVEPVFNAMVETDMSYWVCGACGAFIYGNAYPHMAKDTMPKYCGYCGRAVKWE